MGRSTSYLADASSDSEIKQSNFINLDLASSLLTNSDLRLCLQNPANRGKYLNFFAIMKVISQSKEVIPEISIKYPTINKSDEYIEIVASLKSDDQLFERNDRTLWNLLFKNGIDIRFADDSREFFLRLKLNPRNHNIKGEQ